MQIMEYSDMIKIKKQIHGTDIVTVWFAQKNIEDEGIIQYKEAEFSGDESTEFCTLISDLTESEDNIKGHFSKGCKYKVNRAYREEIQFEILSGNSITDEQLDEYLTFFEEFWKSKGDSLSDRDSLLDEMKAYREHDNLTLAWAMLNGEKAVYHTHIYDKERARLFHSASLYRLHRDEEGNSKSLIGMANRALHYEEMKYFKAKGLKIYDWGGAGKQDEVASITEFKESFGGAPVTYYDFEQIKGIKANIINSLSEIKHRIKG